MAGTTRPPEVLVSTLGDAVIITAPLPHLQATSILRAFTEWNRRYSLSAWSLSWQQGQGACSLLLQMAVPFQSHSSTAYDASAATLQTLKRLRQHLSRYGVKWEIPETIPVQLGLEL